MEDQKKLRERIAELDGEIESYRQAILNAEGALYSAEKELNDLLSFLNREDVFTETGIKP